MIKYSEHCKWKNTPDCELCGECERKYELKDELDDFDDLLKFCEGCRVYDEDCDVKTAVKCFLGHVFYGLEDGMNFANGRPRSFNNEEYGIIAAVKATIYQSVEELL